MSSEEEPSLRRIADIVRFARDRDIKHVFTVQTSNPRAAQTVAGETGAVTLVLHTASGLSGEDARKGRTYISIMDDNLKKLREALSFR